MQAITFLFALASSCELLEEIEGGRDYEPERTQSRLYMSLGGGDVTHTPPARCTGVGLRARLCPACLCRPGAGWAGAPLPTPGKHGISPAPGRVSSVCAAVSRGTDLPFCWVKDSAAYLPRFAKIPASG